MNTLEQASAHIQTLSSHGYQAYLVGGCVRDRLLGIEPKDFDIATDARPDELSRLFPAAQQVGAQFGVLLVDRVEISTFRSEGEYHDGRHPGEVNYVSSAELDAQRRDFTINGLFENLATGQILDYVGGQRDVAARVVRAIGDPERRFTEDHLRMLRAVRFAGRLRFLLEERTGEIIRRQASLIHRVSAERVNEEIGRILTEGEARRGLELLDQTGLLIELLPEIKAFQGVEQPPQYHPEGDVWTHVLLMLQLMGKASRALAWGVLLHDVGKPSTFRRADRIRFDGHAEVGAAMAVGILGRLRVSNELVEHVRNLVANHMRFKDVLQMKVSTLKRFLRMPHFEDHLELHRLDCLASNGHLETYQYIGEQLRSFSNDELRPRPLLTGRDLIAAGFQPGPMFGRLLESIESAQLDRLIHTREEALQLAIELGERIEPN